MMHNAFHWKIFTFAAISLLFICSIILWTQTPDLFEYFNQAFCTH